MNNFILINRTYTETTPESLEMGDFSDTGSISVCERVTFSELVIILMCHTIASCSPNNYSIHVWYSTCNYTKNYITGTERNESIHYCKENTENCVKYWKWAAIIARKKLIKFRNDLNL